MKNKTVVVGIGGGIAAYKTCELVRLLVKEKASVHVVMTSAAKEFVTPLTLQTLSMNPIHTDLFDITQEQKIGHITLADKADIVVIAPATADLMAKAAHGLANDLLTNILLATRAKVLFCPSMNVNMWNHKATQANVKRLQELGYQIMEPDSGELACGYEGKGRLCEPEAILKKILSLG
ncbi:MAG: bifunctional phosphopantothenoylcysteine decarboxylase/phosphopantothenate--cysteine ligase CoaBC [Deltaproteobacteria bacterium]|nr:bifunctional phosphopantothenoylcysteine decarboxylase/phosphopantothenate--cysteine ligase CoaBC [Deltaproteobacteria bacterium]